MKQTATIKQTRKHFSQDFLIRKVRTSLEAELKRHSYSDRNNSITTIDCLMSALAMFTFKCPSMLDFGDRYVSDKTINANLCDLFGITSSIPSDTRMRERLDEITPEVMRKCYTAIFTLLQRAKILDNFKFMEKYHLVSLDGTGFFSSSSVHCDNCCVKEHANGDKTYYHQMLSGALVHPNQKVAYPFASEPILKQDGVAKNDCERNAAKRWLADFRREHPHLQVILLADGLSSNTPFIELLEEHKMHYILVCKEGDHKYTMDWLNAADDEDAPTITTVWQNDKNVQINSSYQYMNNVPLNSEHKTMVNVLRYRETKKEKTSKWIWVTDFKLNENNIKQIMQGGRARWRIENETFNTLKNQGYNFEHNYGHGYKNLSTVLALLMMLAFFIDQVQQSVNCLFMGAYAREGTKRSLWETMRSFMKLLHIDSFELLYMIISSAKHRDLIKIR